jgi:hypothetical protein
MLIGDGYKKRNMKPKQEIKFDLNFNSKIPPAADKSYESVV